MAGRRWLVLCVAVAVACGNEAVVPSAADGGSDSFDGGGPERPTPTVAGTLVEQLINAPTKSANQTSWQGVASDRYLRFALFADGRGAVSEIGAPEVDFSWLPTGDAAVSLSGNPWFTDLTIVEFPDRQTLVASSSGERFRQRWDLSGTAPGQ